MKQVAKLFIRPPRTKYNEGEDLGPKVFKVYPAYHRSPSSGLSIRRDDFLLENERGVPLRATLFHSEESPAFPPILLACTPESKAAVPPAPEASSREDSLSVKTTDKPVSDASRSKTAPRIRGSISKLASAFHSSPGFGSRMSVSSGVPIPAHMNSEDMLKILTASSLKEKEVILYLHGSAGCRVDALHDALDICISHGMAFMTFDFEGCGLSPGKYISIGIRERFTVAAAVQFLRKAGFTRIALWGRSMGSVAAILAVSEGLCSVDAVIADSPYCNLEEVVRHVVKTSKAKILSGIAVAALPMVRTAVLEKVPELDILDVDLRTKAKDFTIPILVVHGVEDDFVTKEQSLKLFDALGTTDELKKYCLVPGGHNSPRTCEFYDMLCVFLHSHFLEKDSPDIVPISMVPLPFQSISDVYICKAFDLIQKKKLPKTQSGKPGEERKGSGSPVRSRRGSENKDHKDAREVKDFKEIVESKDADAEEDTDIDIEDHPASAGTSSKKHGELVMRPRFLLLIIAPDRLVLAEAFTGTILEQWNFAEVESLTSYPGKCLLQLRARGCEDGKWFWNPNAAIVETKYRERLDAFVAERSKVTSPETILANLPSAVSEILASQVRVGRQVYAIEVAESLECSVLELVGDQIPIERIREVVRNAVKDAFPKVVGKEADFESRPKKSRLRRLRQRGDGKCVVS